MNSFSGECFCGKIHVQVTAPTKWCGHCHCTMCQRIHGAGVVTWVGCELNSVTLTNEDHIRWFESSPGASRGSCMNCGSKMFFKSGHWPGEIHITRTCFSGNIDREPAGHAFYDTHVSWLSFDDGLLRQ